MRYDPDFQKMIFEGYRLVSINILYYMPDQKSLLNEFFWQTMDVTPAYPRIKKFLNFWEREIEGRIKEVTISDTCELTPSTWRHGVIIPIG